MRKVALVTINYNGGEMLLETLHSLFTQANSELFDLFLVDNNSTDGSANRAAAEFPNLKLIEAGENLGFGKGNNLALERILAGRYGQYDYVGLINNDLEFEANWLTNLVERFSNQDNLAALNPAMVFSEQFRLVPVEVNQPFVYAFSPTQPRLLSTNLHQYLENGGEYRPDFTVSLGGVDFTTTLGPEFTLTIGEQEAGNDVELMLYNPGKPGRLELSLKVKGGVEGDSKGETQKQLRSNWQLPQLMALKLIPSRPRPRLRKVKFRIPAQAIEGFPTQTLVNSFGTLIPAGEAELPVDRHFAQPLSVLDQYSASDLIPSDGFHGACVLLRAEALREVGLFDPEYFMYYEDADLSQRFSRAGWGIAATRAVTIKHRERGSKSRKTEQFLAESQSIYAKKWG